MGSPDLFRALTRTLRDGDAHAVPAEDVKLTPYLSIVVAILYMMAVDGDISDRESSQLQAVIGADDGVLRRAVAYAQTHEVDSFLGEARQLLDGDASLCLLVNVADSLMADGQLQKVELMLFDHMLSAFGQTRARFQPHFDAIAAKGRTSVLGDFEAAAASDDMTAPKALVVAMLYMMSADGEMAAEEVGRLSAAIGGSQALLKASLRYVSQVRAPQFLPLAAGLLDKRQRLCVLLNVCDAMMSDRQIDVAERELFGRMMAAFGMESASLDAYVDTIRLKNEVPHDDPRPAGAKAPQSAIPPRRRAKREEGVVFERRRTWQEETGEGGGNGSQAARTAGPRAPQQTREGPLDSRISRAMQDNIDRMSKSFEGEVNLETIEKHSRDDAHKDRRTRDGEGPEGMRALADGDGDKDVRSVADGKGASDLRSASDGKGASDLRSASDGKGASDLRSTSDGKGASDVRAARDGAGASDLRRATDGQGEADLRAAVDARGPHDMREARDADALADASHLQDAGLPGGRREMDDAAQGVAGKHLLDDRRAFDNDGDDDADAEVVPQAIEGRMDTVRERTLCIRDHVDALQCSRSLRAGSRLPPLPVLPASARPSVMPDAALLASDDDAGKAAARTPAGDDARMLFASDEGGPKMSETTPPADADEAKTNRKLRLRSAVLLPALFVTYGATMVGEGISERLFITSENIATDARIVHQMASVQQSIYRIAPEAVRLAPDALAVPVAAHAASSVAAATASGEAAPSDRSKAEEFLEQRKGELVDKFRQHQASSAVAAERQQWFIYAKSIVLLGLGMAFWGVLYRSLRMLNASTVSGLIGLLLAANGYWLLLRL